MVKEKDLNEYGNNNAKNHKADFTADMFIVKSELAKRALRPDVHILNIKTDGNHKLVNTDNTRFLIWNIPEIATCPGNCDHKSCIDSPCYAFTNALQRGLNVQRCRIRNYLDSLNPNFAENMIATIEHFFETSYKLRRAKRVYFRIHESGDFYCLSYLLAWYKVAKHFLHSCKKLIFLAYTHSYNLPWFTEKGKPSNFRIRKSDYIGPEDFTYNVVTSADGIPEDNLCKCNHCGEHCNKCYELETLHIFVVAHTVKDGIKYRKIASRCAMSKAYIRWINIIRNINTRLQSGYTDIASIITALEYIIYGA